jgi:hypothetical protein
MSFALFDRIRLLLKRGDVFGHENLLQNQFDATRVFTSGDNIGDLTDPSFLIDQTNVQINRLERYKDYDQMDEVGEVTLALDMYADEASLRDPEKNHSVFVKTNSVRIKEEVEDFLYNILNIDAMIRPMTRYLAKYGDFAVEIVPNANRDGVQSMRPMFVYNFTRVESKYGDLVGFFYQTDGEQPTYLHPWQVSHIRLTSFEQIYHGILDGARRDFRRLRLMEDAALVYRLVRAPEKRVFKVPVGSLPPKEREQYIQIIARRFKKHKFIDPATGTMNEQYAPHIQDDDYWVPVTGDGTGVEIDTLQGAENLDAIADIEYFKKKMVAALKIPFSRVGLGEDSNDHGKSIASQSPEFSKAVQWLQDQLIVGLKKVVLVHLSLRGYSVQDMKSFELGMTSASSIDELYRIETWASRVDIMGGLKDLGVFPDEWIVQSFTDLTADELELIQKQVSLNKDKELLGAGGGGGGEEGGEGEEEGEEFFERKMQKMELILESNKLNDKAKEIRESKVLNSPTASVDKMLLENEFDGIEVNGKSIASDVKDKEKIINEHKDFLTFCEDDEIDISEITQDDMPEN